MTNSKSPVANLLDEAKRSGDFADLEKLLYVYLQHEPNNRPTVVQEALIEIARKMREGEPHFLLAPQLRGILKTCAKRLRAEKARFDSRLGDTGDEALELPAVSNDDPAELFARLGEMHEKIAEIQKLRRTNPRYYEAIVADAQDVPIAEHFQEKLGEIITPANARKIRERAKLDLSKSLEQSRKDSTS